MKHLAGCSLNLGLIHLVGALRIFCGRISAGLPSLQHVKG